MDDLLMRPKVDFAFKEIMTDRKRSGIMTR